LSKSKADIPDGTLCSDLPGTWSRINIFTDQESRLGTEVKAVDRPVKADYLYIISVDILDHTRLVSADDFAVIGSVKPCPYIHSIIGSPIGTSGQHYCGVKPCIPSSKDVQLVIIDDKLAVGI